MTQINSPIPPRRPLKKITLTIYTDGHVSSNFQQVDDPIIKEPSPITHREMARVQRELWLRFRKETMKFRQSQNTAARAGTPQPVNA